VSYRIVLAREAEKILDRLDRPMERRLRVRFVQLAENPFDPRLSSPLTERTGVRKSRVGGWRILFIVDRAAKRVCVLTVDTRGQVYKHS
jgi:mRNA interferase RelE/StbE